LISVERYAKERESREGEEILMTTTEQVMWYSCDDAMIWILAGIPSEHPAGTGTGFL
jgi:hypothetical protein